MNAEKKVLADIISEHSAKLRHWYETLHQIMPDYFFKTFTPSQLAAIMPLLFNIEKEGGLQSIEIDDRVILVYLLADAARNTECDRLIRNRPISSIVVHKSKMPILIDGAARTLVIESLMLPPKNVPDVTPLHSYKAVADTYKKLYKRTPAELKDVYSRLIWRNVADLTHERLAARLNLVLRVQDKDYLEYEIDRLSPGECRLTLACPGFQSHAVYLAKVSEFVELADLSIERSYFRDMTSQSDPHDFDRKPVATAALYIRPVKTATLNMAQVRALAETLRTLFWSPADDPFHAELVRRKTVSLAEADLLRAAAEFAHTQLAFVDRSAYNREDIYRYMALYPAILKSMVDLFHLRFDPAAKRNEKREQSLIRQINGAVGAINSGVYYNDTIAKAIFRSALNFIESILKTNFFCSTQSALSFRLTPDFMHFYEALAPSYGAAFPAERPFGVFFFYREDAIGFQVRFSEIARGGWRTVVPKRSANKLEMLAAFDSANDEIFREVYVLAHTQHMKNKDIYEGGSKMITLLNLEPEQDFHTALWEAQRSICQAFLALINYDGAGRLRDRKIVDRYGRKEIIEIGPDENMFDPMIEWMGNFSAREGYTLGSGLISGKPGSGINHKEFGVTSFGVFQYLLRTMKELGIDPERDSFSVKIAGGPGGDVAGNLMKLLLRRENGKWALPDLKIVAVTDGPAVVCDPDGIDREELARLVLSDNLDGFNPDRLHGDGAYMLFSKPVLDGDGFERHRLVECRRHVLTEKMISRDEFMKIFQNNLYCYADIFLPCGGRPSTLNITNYRDYLPGGVPSSRAIVEGANSFITPEARIKLQEAGIPIVKDASANKCGVITSSYEILSGLMLDEAEFQQVKPRLVGEIMERLGKLARGEAEWLFTMHRATGKYLTELTEELSGEINRKNAEISKYLGEHPELIEDKVILAHLPLIFREKYRDRLSRIPAEYRQAIVSVELATRIVYRQSNMLEYEIHAALSSIEE